MNVDTGESDFDIIRLQRAAKRARLMTEANTSAPVPANENATPPIPTTDV